MTVQTQFLKLLKANKICKYNLNFFKPNYNNLYKYCISNLHEDPRNSSLIKEIVFNFSNYSQIYYSRIIFNLSIHIFIINILHICIFLNLNTVIVYNVPFLTLLSVVSHF